MVNESYLHFLNLYLRICNQSESSSGRLKGSASRILCRSSDWCLWLDKQHSNYGKPSALLHFPAKIEYPRSSAAKMIWSKIASFSALCNLVFTLSCSNLDLSRASHRFHQQIQLTGHKKCEGGDERWMRSQKPVFWLLSSGHCLVLEGQFCSAIICPNIK